LFVFSQPIGIDIIYNFNAASDKIDLIGFNNFGSFSDIQANLTDDANGNAVITFGIGETITLQGVHAASLIANDFVFDQVPVTANAGSMTISDGATLPLSGTINNTGTIALNSTGTGTGLQIIEHGVTLEGAGQVILSDSAENVISGTSAAVTLTNVDNTIDGSGDLGGGQLTLINDSHGTIAATGFNQLTIDTGAGSFTNHGIVLSNGAGGLEIKGGLYSDGVLEASAGLLKVDGDVVGGGHALIDGGSMEFVAASDAIVQFSGQTAGTLVLDDVSHFTGSITGFAYGDTIDLAGIDPANVSVGNSGALEVHYGPGFSDFFSLAGNYDPASFTIGSDNNGTGTDIVWNRQGPAIETDQVSLAQNPDGTTTISGLHISDADPTASLTLAAATDVSASSVTTPSSGSGTLAETDTALESGVTYDPATAQSGTDKIAVIVTDSFGGTDSVNFIFNEAAMDANIVLQGTAGKDVIFGTGSSDTLTGGGGLDQFVFAPTTAGPTVQHTITDFIAGLDKIDIRQFGNITASTLPTETQQGSDTLITLDSHDSLLLKNVTVANLHANDFIISAHG
jgi:Ca2+-binding RTX toxin-like protein